MNRSGTARHTASDDTRSSGPPSDVAADGAGVSSTHGAPPLRGDASTADSPVPGEGAARGAPSGAGAEREFVRTGIVPFDERLGGLRGGGTYLIAGPPGPAKLVAGLHFLKEGINRAEKVALLTNADAGGMLGVAEAWGFDLRDAFDDDRVRIIGFRDDFELRAVRTTEPETIFDELDDLVGDDVGRIVVDPASAFLSIGVPSQLGRGFLSWAGRTGATVCGTLAVEGPERLPPNADWLLQSSTGILVVTPRSGDLFQLELVHALPDARQDSRPVTVDLRAGSGLVVPDRFPTRRSDDERSDTRPAPDPGKLLLLSLDGAHADDLEAWARRSWSTDVLSDAVTAITELQAGARYGVIVVHAGRQNVHSAVRACRALRPLTAAAIVFATDDSIRSNDRIRILDAGADDCMSGGLDFGELGTRLRHAIEAGPKEGPASRDVDGTASIEGGSVSRATLAAEASRRATRPSWATFTVISFSAPSSADPELLAAVRDEIRDEDGDLVAADSVGCVVLLQGARRSAADVFLARVRKHLAGSPDGVAEEPDVWSHPASRSEIERLLAVSLATPKEPGAGGDAGAQDDSS